MTTAPEFGFVAHHPALDLCNTVGEWAGGVPVRDKLGSWADLVAWAVGAALLSPAEAAALRRPREEGRIVARARAFRTALHALVLAAIEGRRPSPADLAAVQRELSRARVSERLAAAPEGYRWRWADPVDAERPLLEAARAAAELLAGPLGRIRSCKGENCGWLFRDTSRSGRRRWCSMSTCGNTAKVRRFRRR